MKTVMETWRDLLQNLFKPPWKATYASDGATLKPWEFIFMWVMNWLVSLAGFVALGIFAPYWVEWFGVPSQYQTWLTIGIAFVGGLLWQFIAVALGAIYQISSAKLDKPPSMEERTPIVTIALGCLAYFLFLCVLSFAPFIATGVIVWWYFSDFAPHHDLVGTSVLGATILKIFFTIILPALKSLTVSVLFRLVKRIMWGPEKREQMYNS